MIARLPEMHRQLRELSAQVEADLGRRPPSPIQDGDRRATSTSGRPRRRSEPIDGDPHRLLKRIEGDSDVSTLQELAPIPGRRTRLADRRSAARADRPAGRQRPVPDPLRRGRAAAGAAGRLRRHPVRGARRAARPLRLVRDRRRRQARPDDPHFRRQGVQRDRDGGQGHEERDVHPLADRPALPRLPDDPDVVPPQPRRQPRRLDPAGRDRRVRARRDDVRLGPGLLPGAARERRNPHPPRAHGRRAEGHRVRLDDWPRRWAGSTSASRSPSRRRPPWPSRPSRGPTAASNAPGSSAGPAAGRSSRSPSRSRTCGSTSPRSASTTIENLHKAGARVLAIEAGRTIVIDQPDVVALADRYGIAIIAVRGRLRRLTAIGFDRPETLRLHLERTPVDWVRSSFSALRRTDHPVLGRPCDWVRSRARTSSHDQPKSFE